MKRMNKVLAVILSLVMMITIAPANNGTSKAAEEAASGYAKIHDPSIVIGYYEGETYSDKSVVYGTQNADNSRKKIYFIFGSHKSFAYSLDLKEWKTFTNNINTSAATLFAEDAKWASMGAKSAGYWNIHGNLWAPDVIWNPDYDNGDGTKGAWMMYMSIAGINRNSVITLLTSKSLNGDWTRKSAIVYSGFDKGDYDYTKTDYKAVTGDTDLNARYMVKDGEKPSIAAGTTFKESRSNREYCAHAIDPCVLYDNGKLWMSYGSWDGGIYLIELDKTTGLRDTTHKYQYKVNESDPYMGIKIAGGEFAYCGGEASYIKKIGNKYYLFISYEALESTGGYNMRVWSSDSITGPYKDISGDNARISTAASGATPGTYSTVSRYRFGTIGTRLMSYYKWNHMDYGFVAQGHNSVLSDTDGKNYVVYHTRFTNKGEYFEDRIHQLFVAKNGGIVAAPFEYDGETLATKAYDAAKVAGSYQILSMVNVKAADKECVTEKTMTLNLDGTVTGEYTGTWSQASDGPYVTLKIKSASSTQSKDEATYQGVFVEQTKEGTKDKVMCLTIVGNNDLSVWGYKTKDADPLPVKSADPAQTNKPANTTTAKGPVKGKTYTVGKLKYKATSKTKVTVTGVKNKKLTSAAIGATVKIKGKSVKVTAISSNAFAKCKKLKKVTIGKNVTKIGKKAFYKCSALKTVTVKGKKVKSVGKNAFKGIAKKAKLKTPASKKKAYKKLFKIK